MTCALKATLARRKDSSPPKCNKQMTWAATCDVHGHRPYAFSKKLDVFIVYRERRGGRTGWILVKGWCTYTQTLDKVHLVWLSFLSLMGEFLYGQLIFTYIHGIRLGRDDLWRFEDQPTATPLRHQGPLETWSNWCLCFDCFEASPYLFSTVFTSRNNVRKNIMYTSFPFNSKAKRNNTHFRHKRQDADITVAGGTVVAWNGWRLMSCLCF